MYCSIALQLFPLAPHLLPSNDSLEREGEKAIPLKARQAGTLLLPQTQTLFLFLSAQELHLKLNPSPFAQELARGQRRRESSIAAPLHH